MFFLNKEIDESYKNTNNYEGETFEYDENDEEVKEAVWKRLLKHFGAIIISGILFMVFFVIFVLSSNSAFANFITSRGVVAVPNIQGAEINNARRVLESLSLKIDIMDTEFNELPEGYIINQIPASGREIYVNRTVQVITSRGQKLVTMPTLRGAPFHNINDVLRTHELRLGTVTRRYSNEVASGFIITTAPPSGESIMAGTEINIVLSIGRDPLDPLPMPIELEPPPFHFFGDYIEESIF
ncbi:MAG: PASTA domain-containing protein [Candidatus Cloacimonetes bacterium]|nr:PASTA domain-containing protein [Candidatus Cloacimonadota bacterium]